MRMFLPFSAPGLIARWAALGTVSGAIALVTLGAIAPTAQAQSRGTNFVCENDQNSPATVAYTSNHSRGVLIRWNSGAFAESGWNDWRRCEAVSARFQDQYNQGRLNYMTFGFQNGETVICVAAGLGQPCATDGLLYTLKRTQNPQQTLRALQELRSYAATPLNETATVDVPEAPDPNYFNIGAWLDQLEAKTN